MENEIIEETNEPQEEAPAEEIQEQPKEEVKETPKEKTESPEQYSEREKRYYARMKQAENMTKTAREELAKVKKPQSVQDIDAIIEVQEATRGLSATEIAELKVRADIQKTSLSDARKNENFVLWQKAYKEKVEKENVPLPSTTQGEVEGEKDLKDLSLDERTKIFENLGLITKQIPPKPSRQ